MAENLNNQINNQVENNATDTNNTGANEVKTYTEEEVQELLQRESDRRVTAALKKQADKQKESEKLSKMNETEKYEYELNQREAAIAEKERQLLLAENKNTASKILVEKGLSLELVDFVLAEDANTMDKNIKLLDKAFKASVKAEVEKRLGSKAPVKQMGDPTALTKEQFAKMSLSQKQELYHNNREVYDALRTK